MANRIGFWSLIAVALVFAPGASCIPWKGVQKDPLAPLVFEDQTPSMATVLQTLQKQSDAVRQLRTEDAKISMPGSPSLQAHAALERPKNFRLRASFPGMGQVLDLGSNQDIFWAAINAPEILTGTPPGVYYARHDQFRQSAARQLMPVEPHWISEALGVVSIPNSPNHQGPFPSGENRLQIRLKEPTPQGEFTKVLTIHSKYGWILENQLYDPSNRLLASAKASKHHYYEASQVSLPHQVEIKLPPAGMEFSLKIGGYAVNRLGAAGRTLWNPPAFDNYENIVNLADPRLAPSAPTIQQAGYAPPPDPRQNHAPQGYSPQGYSPQIRYNAPSQAWPADNYYRGP